MVVEVWAGMINCIPYVIRLWLLKHVQISVNLWGSWTPNLRTHQRRIDFFYAMKLYNVNIIQEWIITTTKTLQSYKHDI